MSPVWYACPRAPSSFGHHHCPFGQARSALAMSSSSSLRGRAPEGVGSASRNSLGHASSHPGTVLQAIGSVCGSMVRELGCRRVSLAMRLVGTDGFSPNAAGSGHISVSPDTYCPVGVIPASNIASTGDSRRSQYRRSSSIRSPEETHPAYPHEYGCFARNSFGLGLSGSTSTIKIPGHASGKRLCRTGVVPHPFVQLANACSKSVSLSMGSLAGSCSQSLLLDSRRKHERSSSSRPSAPNRRPARCSQTALAFPSSSFCRFKSIADCEY
jgi:hypothetical protein